jgi:hypothetical protein
MSGLTFLLFSLFLTLLPAAARGDTNDLDWCERDSDCSDTDRTCRVSKCQPLDNDILNRGSVCTVVAAREGIRCSTRRCNIDQGKCVDGECQCPPAETAGTASMRESRTEMVEFGGALSSEASVSSVAMTTTTTEQPSATMASSADRNDFSASASETVVSAADINVVASEVSQMADDDEESSGRRNRGNGNLDGGAVAGIVIGSILALALLALAVYLWHKKKKSSSHIMPLSSTAMSDMSSARDRADTDVEAELPAKTRAPVQMYGPVNPENGRGETQNNYGSAPPLLRGAALYDAPPKGFGANDPSVSPKSGKSHYETVHDPLVK